MAARRPLLNTRDLQGVPYPRALPEESRQMVKAKMEAIGYPISPHPPAVPEKEWSRKNNNRDTILSLKPVKYQENPQPRHQREPSDFDRSTYTSVYEQRLSQDISPALNNHLAYRSRKPTNVSETNINGTIYENRRRSRSAADDAYDSRASMDYSRSQARRPQEDSRSTSQPPRHYREGSEPATERHEYTVSPEVDHGAFQPLATIGHSNRKQSKSNKNSKDNSGPSNTNTNTNTYTNDTTKHSTQKSPNPSPSNSIDEGIKHSLPAMDQSSPDQPRKRPRSSSDLDYTMEQLSSKPYSELASEPFDHNPPSFFAQNTPLIQRLPSPTLPLPARLQTLFDTSAANNHRATLSKVLFASLTIDRYEECGDLLLERFGEIVGKLKEARQVKRKACRAMEEEVARREAWVGRKRDSVEGGLGRLKTTGMNCVVRPREGNSGLGVEL